MARFPQEVVEQFISYLNEDANRLKTLASCSLVSQIWCSITHPFLYSRLSLDIGTLEHGFATPLIDSISESSQIQASIRHFLITGSSFSTKLSLLTLSSLGHLPSLRSLHLRSDTSMGHSPKANPGLAASLQPMLSSRSLTSLELSHFGGFPAQSLYNCVALQRLAIWQVTFEFPPSESGSNIDKPAVVSPLKERPVLRSFILSSHSREGTVNLNWLRSPHSPFDLSQLETFIGVDRGNTAKSYEVHCKLISYASHSLKTVLIDPPTSCSTTGVQNPLGVLEPQKLQKITSLTLCIDQIPRDYNSLPWLIAILSGLPNPETLHDLTLACDIDADPATGFSYFARGWSEVDALLGRFPNLQSVHVKCYDERVNEVANELIAWFYKLFPIWVSKGVLSVECFPDGTYTRSMHQQLMGW
ncbi:hypothetical protein BDN72DRAFT_883014 [Pluteus cervinus]|uniref:Uncharacterized protein n=1 Tax=Pluteus cervinus TaxID=181527 RepID=A0ACD3A7U2_9AGAR|nr:hypothetical protein BDN72DRAFT_883014 [Pluteus cervinus]